MIAKITAKKVLGELPLTAEAYWHLRQPGKPLNKSFTLHQLQAGLSDWRTQAEKSLKNSQPGKNVLIFSTLHYWISHATIMGLALAGLGHKVDLAYLPYGKWQKPLNRFDLRRQNTYAQDVLHQAYPLVKAESWLGTGSRVDTLPREIIKAVEEISLRDTQYTLQMENISREGDLYQLRLARNSAAARAALAYLKSNRPDTVVIPNGSILEFGVVYQVARFLGIPVVTYEFGEQRQRIWLGKDVEVMNQQTDDLWLARGGHPLSEVQLDQVRQLFAARQKASLWENFSRRWQGAPSIGGQQMRIELGLDNRPIVLLATNVIGDSLTLGRQVFSDSMTEWLKRTVLYFASCNQVQLVVRIHPGELITKGPSVADVLGDVFPDGLPNHIHLVPAEATVNTYDIVEISDLGLVYTTTVGLEMAMSGVPVVVVGQTHYRQKGFTLDPSSWESYFELLDRVLFAPEKFRLSRIQVERAWEYAYRFFFEYPFPFPWHLVHLWTDVKDWPINRVLDKDGQSQFGDTFRYLVGEIVDWTR